ncbi:MULTISPECIES: glycosyltransferase family 2 protein [Leclercia]|uniref:glycosyltransferase family 2 protein n=1 Tax=Leclercia TaxID=83654 RepID=UPI000CD213B6|nr:MULTISPECIES: glycosyltransferase family 2 protein [Leclercia]AUU86115.1 hypothetical protein C2U54_19790 [Leclercia sp. LSNIH1]POV36409.1 hypothetical protein C3388_03810 [Leclercia sp. LSNIH5]POW68647.1 hypothetical protein C3389_02635 [Leclercia sp. LSNIH2]
MSYEVILATYNGERYIREQVVSILAQSIKPSRIIIRDDGSTDSTLAILEALKTETDIKIDIIHDGLNLGYIKNFEKLTEHVTSEIVFFSDQDDIWVENKAETLLAVFSNQSYANVVFSDAWLINNAMERLGTLWQHVNFTPANGDIALEKILINNVVTGATMAVRKVFLNSVMPFPEKIPHDYWLASNACALGSLVPVEDKLILYRQHENNQIGAKKSTFAGKLKAAFDRKKRDKRIAHYREIYDLTHALRKSQQTSQMREISEYILNYLGCVNTIYRGSIFAGGERKGLVSALLSSSYMKYSTKKSIIRDLLDGLFIRLNFS